MAQTTTHMGLIKWDLDADHYDHAQLANNFGLLDDHDHAPGKGVQLGTNSLKDNAVTGAKLAPGAIGPNSIDDGSIPGYKLVPSSVTATELADNSVGRAELQDGAVGKNELDPSLVPIGQVIAWYRPNTAIDIPADWEVMDGRPWSSIPNAWGLSAGNMPDVRNKFILGAAIAGPVGPNPTDNPDIGQTGGSQTKNLAHAHNVLSHTHTIPSHAHAMDHYHSYMFPMLQESGVDPMDPDMSLITATVFPVPWSDLLNTHNFGHGAANDSGVINVLPNSTYDYVVAEPVGDDLLPYADDYFTYRPQRGDLTITGVATSGPLIGGASVSSSSPKTQTDGTSLTTNSASPATDSQLSTVDIRPAYIGLLYLMRVR